MMNLHVQDVCLDDVDKLLLRPVEPSDWAQIWPIWKHVVAAGETHPYPTHSTERDAIKLWVEPHGSAIYVAESGGTIVAAMMTKPMRYGHGDHIANFDLMVHPEHRSKGVGRALASYVIDETRAAGYAAMEAYAVVDANVPAVALWHSLGFKTMATIPDAFRHPNHGLVPVHYMYQRLGE